MANNLGNPSPFTTAEAQQFEMANSTAQAFNTFRGGWTLTRNAVHWQIQSKAKFDTYEFLYAADLMGGYISTALRFIGNFVLGLQQGGASKLDAVPLGEWETFAKQVNALIAQADLINRAAPKQLSITVNLQFRPVVENLRAPPAPT